MFIMERGKMMKDMAKEFLFGKMEIHIKEIGKIIKNVVTVFTNE